MCSKFRSWRSTPGKTGVTRAFARFPGLCRKISRSAGSGTLRSTASAASRPCLGEPRSSSRRFSAGDGHGVQGDGEVCVTALETALCGTFRLILRKDLKFELPRAETPTHHITMGFNEDLDDAAKTALREMIALVGERLGLSPEDAYMFCSLAVDMRVTQLVDGNKGIHAMLPKRYAGPRN